jgi:hypothetical protein
MEDEQGGKRWTRKETLDLIAIVDSKKIMSMLDSKKKNHLAIFKVVAEEMAKKKYLRTSKQCKVCYIYIFFFFTFL